MSASELELSIVLPAYEEEGSLREMLPALQNCAGSLTPLHEIVVVDTMEPRDATPNLCAKLGVRYCARRGGDRYGDAVRTGFSEARGKWILMMDADGSHNPTVIPRLWEHRQSSDLVIASRYVLGGKTENPAILILMSQTVNVIFRLVLNLNCYDVSNSCRLYRAADVKALDLECSNFDIVEEILVKLGAMHPGLRIKEVPFTFEKRKAGKTKRRLVIFILGYVGTLFRLLRLKWRSQRASARP